MSAIIGTILATIAVAAVAIAIAVVLPKAIRSVLDRNDGGPVR